MVRFKIVFICYHRLMTVQTQRILDEALQLPSDERVEIVHALLRSVDSPTGEPATASEECGTFSEKWRGKFELAERNDERYQALARKYR